MGLEFLREHGGQRVRPYPPQPELDHPDAEPTDEANTPEPAVQLDYEGRAWQPIRVAAAAIDWNEIPRRFVDGCHLGQTIAWLQDRDGHPIPLQLAEIGGVCAERDGRDLRRAFAAVERVVAFIVDPFPWDEVEAFAVALAGSGFRLLPTSALDLKEGGGWTASFDFEVMRRKTQGRSLYEMQILEEVALCQHATVPSLVDGPLEPRLNSDERLQQCPIVGVVKQQRRDYLDARGWRTFLQLEPGERTPAFLIGTKVVPVVSWHLKLAGNHGSLPNWGTVRVEIPQVHFETRGDKDFGFIDRLSHALIQLRSRLESYGRSPVSLAPIVRAEELLRALFAPTNQLAQQFYRLTDL